jgi:hypothetical protein
MTLLSEIQDLIERTYERVEINLEDCVIGKKRSEELMSLTGRRHSDFGGSAVTFLRKTGDTLRIAIYFSSDLIDTLEQEHPRESISHRNIHSLISFIEEITHGVHAACAFRNGWHDVESNQFATNLELQAKVDVYWILLRFCKLMMKNEMNEEVRAWLKERIFDDGNFDYDDQFLVKRYERANRWAREFVDGVELLPVGERVAWIKDFQRQRLLGKRRLLRKLRKSF